MTGTSGPRTGLRILMMATEAAPFVKEGGVGDVIGSLPKALAELGHDVRVAIPRYGTLDPARWHLGATGLAHSVSLFGVDQMYSIWRGTLPDSNVTTYFFENDAFFGRLPKVYLGLDQRDEQRRFLLFCRGLLDALPGLDFYPDIIHLNDWQTAPAAAYLRTTHRHLLRGGAARIVYTIHNLQYQGRWDPTILDEAGLNRAEVFMPIGLEYWGDVNWMKAGIVYADALTTVSRQYAEEIQTMPFGWGLDELLFQRHPRLFGIPNGIDWDAWNPATDAELATRFSGNDEGSGGETSDFTSAKAANRSALHEEFGLPDLAGVPVFGIVSRLVDQKGFDLLAQIADELKGLPLQLVVLGTGHPEYEQLFRDLSESSDNVRARIGFDLPLSHRIYGGADFFLMPSAFEPGGLGQLIAMRYGTVPVVHATGGLADTVRDVDTDPTQGNGIRFEVYVHDALLGALRRAITLFADSDRWPAVVRRALAYDSRWSASARAYSDLYRGVLRLPPTQATR